MLAEDAENPRRLRLSCVSVADHVFGNTVRCVHIVVHEQWRKRHEEDAVSGRHRDGIRRRSGLREKPVSLSQPTSSPAKAVLSGCSMVAARGRQHLGHHRKGGVLGAVLGKGGALGGLLGGGCGCGH
jgi:hypothetical protein